MLKSFELIILLIAMALIVCAGCTSINHNDDKIPDTQTIPMTSAASTIKITPTGCPSLENSSPWIHLDRVADHTAGDFFVLRGTTNLETGEILSVFVFQSPPSPNKKMPSGFTEVRGITVVQRGNCHGNIWSFSDNLTILRPSLYTVYVTAENATVEANLMQFNIIDNRTFSP